MTKKTVETDSTKVVEAADLTVTAANEKTDTSPEKIFAIMLREKTGGTIILTASSKANDRYTKTMYGPRFQLEDWPTATPRKCSVVMLPVSRDGHKFEFCSNYFDYCVNSCGYERLPSKMAAATMYGTGFRKK